MKGLILAAGQGTRLAELNLTHKSFAEVNKKHIIDFSLDLLTEKGKQEAICSELIVVVGYHAKSIMDYIGNSYNGVPVKYAFQAERKGIAHAVMTAKDILDDDFIMCLADEILFNPRLSNMVSTFYEHEAECVCGCVYDPTDFSMKPIAYEIADNNTVTKVMEKPKNYSNGFRGVGECIFSKNCLEFLDELQPNPIRGEYEMGDWIQLIVNAGRKVEVFHLADAYYNINSVKDLKNAEEELKMMHDKSC